MRLKSRLVTLLVTVVGVTALSALTASAALAVVAHWNVSLTSAHWKGSLTVETEGKSPVTCSNLDMRVATGNISNQGYANIIKEGGGALVISCAGGTTLELYREGHATFNGTNYELTFIVSESGIWLESPFGVYFDDPWVNPTPTATVTNGSKETSSKVTFSKDPVGELENGKHLTISGTLTITTSLGGLLTLST